MSCSPDDGSGSCLHLGTSHADWVIDMGDNNASVHCNVRGDDLLDEDLVQ